MKHCLQQRRMMQRFVEALEGNHALLLQQIDVLKQTVKPHAPTHLAKEIDGGEGLHDILYLRVSAQQGGQTNQHLFSNFRLVLVCARLW